MRPKNFLFMTTVLALSVFTTPALFAQAGAATTPQKPSAVGKQGGDNDYGHPAIRKAINHLQEAKEILKVHAENDFEGHKNQAMKNIDEALEHLNQALKVKQ